MPNYYNIDEISPGESFFLSFQATSCSGGYTNLTNYSLNSQIKEKYSASTGISYFISNIIYPTSGICSIALSGSQTSGLAAGIYLYSVYALNTGTKDCISLLEGHLPIGAYPAF